MSKTLRDYITEVQSENEKLKKEIHDVSIAYNLMNTKVESLQAKLAAETSMSNGLLKLLQDRNKW